MTAFKKRKSHLRDLTKNTSVVVALVLIWRGIWYLLDGIDIWLFGGSHAWTAGIGLLLGLAILYLPDRDLDELGKL